MRQMHKHDTGLKRTQQKNRKCQHCGAVFRTNGLLYFHLRKVHNIRKPIKCKVCGGNFMPGAQWNDHKKLHPEHFPCYTCSVCESKFFTLTYFQKHLVQSGHRHDVGSQKDVNDNGAGPSVESDSNIETNDSSSCHNDQSVVCEKIQTVDSIDNEENSKLHDQGHSEDNAENILNNIIEGHDTDESVLCETDKTASASITRTIAKAVSRGSVETPAFIACPKCSKSFKNYISYQQHVFHKACDATPGTSATSEHKGVKSKLVCCDKIYDTNQKYNMHIQMHYGGKKGKKKMYECPGCKKLVNHSSMWYHAMKHSGMNQFSCDQCDYKCILETDMAKHERSHTDIQPYQCKFCSRKFRTRQALGIHENLHLGVKHECAKCHQQFYDKSRCKSHQRTCLGNGGSCSMPIKSPGSLGYLCNKCFGLCFYRNHFTTHQRECRSESISQAPVKLNVNDKFGKMREVPLESLHICQDCSQVFEHEGDLETHKVYCRQNEVRRHRKKRKAIEGNVNRDHESGTTIDVGGNDDDDDDVSDIVEHMDQQLPDLDGDSMPLSHTASPVSKVAKRKPSNSSPCKTRKSIKCGSVSTDVVCHTCNRTTEEIIRQECTSHEITRQSEQDVVDHQVIDDCIDIDVHCNKCQRSTETLLLQHKCTPQFYCKSCKKAFTSKTVLEVHKTCTKRKTSKEYTCLVCKMHLARKSDFQAHVRSHKQESQKVQDETTSRCKEMIQPRNIFKCIDCNQTFPNNSELTVHLETHKQEHLQEETAYQHQERSSKIVYRCPVCKQSFPNKKDRNLHLRTQCHIENQIPQENVQHLSASQLKKLRARRRKERQSTVVYHCPVCKQNFPNKKDRNLHLRNQCDMQNQIPQENVQVGPAHQDQERNAMTVYQCLLCKQNFPDNSDLDLHIRSRVCLSLEKTQQKTPYQCQFCKQTCMVESNLHLHLRTHSDEMPHCCDYCYMCYGTHSELTTHMTEKHTKLLDLITVVKNGLPP